jgi:hypothetical protein
VANPPPIEEVRFSYVGPPVYRRDERSQWHKEPGPREFFWARYQAGNLVNIKIVHPGYLKTDVFTNFLVIPDCSAYFQWNDEIWFFRNPGCSMTFWRGRVRPPIDTANPLLIAHEFETVPIWSLLSMGPHFVEPGSICWSGNRFETEARLNNERFTVSAEVFRDSVGRAGKMAMHYKSSTADGHYEVAYTYGTNTDLPYYLPSRIRSVVLQDQKTDSDKEISIFSMQLAPRPLPAKSFWPEIWSSGVALSRFVYTNKSLFRWNRDGELQPVPFRDRVPVASPSWVLVHANRYYYMACILLSVGFLILDRRMRLVKQTLNEGMHLCKDG